MQHLLDGASYPVEHACRTSGIRNVCMPRVQILAWAHTRDCIKDFPSLGR